MWPPWKTPWVFECLMTQSYNRNSQLRSLPRHNYFPTSLNITELWSLKAFQTKPLKALLRSLFSNQKNCAHCTTITKSWKICVKYFIGLTFAKMFNGCIAHVKWLHHLKNVVLPVYGEIKTPTCLQVFVWNIQYNQLQNKDNKQKLQIFKPELNSWNVELWCSYRQVEQHDSGSTENKDCLK